LTCGTLTVPEDRSKPHGRVVQLDVFRAPARGKATSDPVLDFGADDLASSPARDHREEIVLAQRGYGGAGLPSSKPLLQCPEYSSVAGDALVKPSGDPAETAREVAAIRRCYERLSRSGIDLSEYNYLTVGDDMADLIRALHFSQVNIVSGYVGTISALEVARVLPGVVRSVTLQDPVPSGLSSVSDPTRYLSNAFRSYIALCNANDACKASFPDLAGDLKRDYEMYRTHPRLAMGDDGNGHKHEVLIDGPRVAEAVYGALFNINDYAVLAAGVAAKDRTQAIDELTAGRIDFYNALVLDPKFPWGANFSNECAYDQYTTDQGHVLSSSASPELSGVDTDFLAHVCAAWPVHKIGAAAFDDANTSAPVFAVTGALAPGQDQSWPDDFQRSLPNATAAVFPTLSGGVLNQNDPKCLAELRREFLDNPNATLNVAACVKQSPAIHFATG
jgi:pimeloyl-ACP methyl ester carboxylesterase